MASVEKISQGGRDCYRLRFLVERRRVTVGLGSFEETEANDAAKFVDHLLDCMKRNKLPDVKAVRWLDALPADLHSRLAAIRLVEPRIHRELPGTVVRYMRAYIASRTDWKKSCNHKQSVDHLERFLGKDIPIRALTKGEADRFHRWMMEKTKSGPRLSANTAGQHIKRCRQMMRAAIDDRLIESNPFSGIKIDLRSDTSKNRFIDAATSQAVLDACPDQEWRTLFALCRWGGLRCPSEVLGLRWSDIQWDRGRFKVRSPKTEKQGKAERVVPLFAELLAELKDLESLVAPGLSCSSNSFVISSYRDTETNLRSMFGKIIERAGSERWPKPFMALRASRRTELERSGRHPNHVLNAWFGHTGQIAETHYLQVTEDDFAVAINSKDGAVGTSVGTSLGQQKPSKEMPKCKNPVKTGVVMDAEGVQMGQEYTLVDSNH
jgi:integrase